jgi:hypothetical protein
VTADIFVVDSSAVFAAPNGVPAGASKPLGQAAVTLHLAIAGTTLSLACTGVDLGAIGAALGSHAASVQQQIQQSIGTVCSLDVGAIVTSIGLPAPSSSSVDIIAMPVIPPELEAPLIPGHVDPRRTVVVIRFDPVGPSEDRLQAGQEWCLFADADTMLALVKTKLDSALAGVTSVITSHTTNAAWTPSGTTPDMKVTVAGKAQVPDPFSGDVHVSMDVVIGLIHTFSVTQGPAADLTLDVSWSLSVDLGWAFDFLVPHWVTDLVVNALASQLVDPTKFGAVKLGSQEFELLVPLPPLAFGSATFNYGSVVGLQDGMVLGGSVTLPPGPDTSTVSFDVGQFPDTFRLLVDCSKGSAEVKPTLAAVTTSAAAAFDHAGAVCDIHFTSPASPPVPLTPYLTAPASGTVTESGVIAVTLPGTAALALAQGPQPIQLWVQTARGVRLLDLGIPPSPQLDDQGDVTNCRVMVLDDCPWAVTPWTRIFHMYNPKWSVDPPESWTETLERVERFETVLIDVSGIQPGSVVRLDMPIMGSGAGSLFAADGAGRALVPAVLAARSDDEGARLSTADRQTLGDVAASTVVFERVAILDTPGAVSHELAESAGAAIVTSRFSDGHAEAMYIDALRVPRVVETGSGLNADLSSPGHTSSPPNVGGMSYRAGPGPSGGAPSEPGIPGLVALHPIPGFENAGLQVAELDDGSHVAVVEEGDRMRATGTIPAWPHMPPSGEAWAISSSTGDRVAVFAVSRTVPTDAPDRLPYRRPAAGRRVSGRRSLPR